MSKLFITVGIPGTGKSTWASAHHGNDVIVSSDAIREELSGDAKDQTRNKEVFEIFYDRIRDGILAGADVVADSTALDWYSRRTLREIARSRGAEVHLVIFDNVKQAARRNMRRERVVPDQAMRRMLDEYEKFKIFFLREQSGYDSIIEIRSMH